MGNKILHLWGLSHHAAPISIREKITFSEKEIDTALKKITRGKKISEASLLSTCNRTEIYIVSDSDADFKKELEELLKGLKKTFSEDVSDFAYYLKNEDAVRHLFRVASGLDSMILGETQILGQVKKSYFLAKNAGATGLYLNRLFHITIQTAKKVRSETPIGEGSMSIAFAAVELAQKIFKDLKQKKGLLIGVGKIGKLTAKNLRERSMGEIYLINRTFSKAVRAADHIGAIPLPWEKIENTLKIVDFVICSTDHNRYIIDKSLAEKAGLYHKNKPTLLIDISVPRDIDPGIKEIENIFLHDIDDLKDIVKDGTAKRKKAVPQAMRLIKQEIAEFIKWSQYVKIRPTLIALKEKLNEYADIELSRYRNKMDEEQIKYLEQALKNLKEKLLRSPAKKLKEYSNGYLDGDLRVDVVREIFELKDIE